MRSFDSPNPMINIVVDKPNFSCLILSNFIYTLISRYSYQFLILLVRQGSIQYLMYLTSNIINRQLLIINKPISPQLWLQNFNNLVFSFFQRQSQDKQLQQQQFKRMDKNKDLQLYQRLQREQGQQQQDLQPPSPAIGFIIHAVLKAIVIALFILKGAFAAMFSQLVINELLAIFVVIDFWFTKNVGGKKLIGIRWFFQNDEFGTQKFMFECRGNEQYISGVGPKLFWLILLVYTTFPLIMMILSIIQAPFLFINFNSIIVSFGILLGGGSNFFFFFQAQKASSSKQKQLKKKLGVDLLRRLKMVSVTSYS